MVTVYGYSDDLIEIERNGKHLREVDCWEKAVRVKFTDGTVIRISYGKILPLTGKSLAVWGIKITKKGTAKYSLSLCFDEDAERYSDEFTIDAEVESVRCVR